jgi:hypothetical protein
MKYSVHSRLTESTYPIQWYVCDELGRWVHNGAFLTKEMAEEFLKEFLAWIESKEPGVL